MQLTGRVKHLPEIKGENGSDCPGRRGAKEEEWEGERGKEGVAGGEGKCV